MILRFQVFGFPVQVLPGFWLLAALIGLQLSGQSLALGLAVAAVAFVSVLAHELGHAMTARHFGESPRIQLHMTGGATIFGSGTPMGRARDIVVSLAGPAAGLGLSLLAYGLLYATGATEGVAAFALQQLVTLNLYWSIFNLVPVIPFDGGRVLAAALGPSRRNVAAGVSLGIGLLLAVFFLRQGSMLLGLIFGSAALSSFSALRAQPPQPTTVIPPSVVGRLLKAARRALDSEDYAEAAKLSEGAMMSFQQLDGRPEKSQVLEAAEIQLWARLGLNDLEGARALAKAHASLGVDAYVLAAVHERTGHFDEAQAALVSARANGDQRVEVTALLIKVLLQMAKPEPAASLTVEVLDRVEHADARLVAEQVRAAGARGAAARLTLAIAKHQESFSDAREAVLAFAEEDESASLREAFELAVSLSPTRAKSLLAEPQLEKWRDQLSLS